MDDLMTCYVQNSFRCRSYCQEKGYTYFGVMFGVECWCNADAPGAEHEIEQTEWDCEKTCTDDTTKACGGMETMSVYRISHTPPPPGKVSNDISNPNCFIMLK